ncbi:MAG: hypothetical protein KDA79_20965, partial [Planctomycetaceae bacterium]|nr:hypothetical protein [Planctomycetaceae bacterium]
TGNIIRGTAGPAVVVKDSTTPAHVSGNTLISDNPASPVVDVQGPAGVVAENVVRPSVPIPEDGDSQR